MNRKVYSPHLLSTTLFSRCSPARHSLSLCQQPPVSITYVIVLTLYYLNFIFIAPLSIRPLAVTQPEKSRGALLDQVRCKCRYSGTNYPAVQGPQRTLTVRCSPHYRR